MEPIRNLYILYRGNGVGLNLDLQLAFLSDEEVARTDALNDFPYNLMIVSSIRNAEWLENIREELDSAQEQPLSVQ